MKNRLIKCFDKISKVSEYLHYMHESAEKMKLLDCGMCGASSETEKAWVFDYTQLYKSGECGKRFYYAPKSVCKVLENDHYINEDGSIVTDTKFILMPDWVDCRIGAW